MGSGSVSPRPIQPPSVPATEPGSDTLPSRDVPNIVASKSLSCVSSYWEAMPHVREVSVPTTIEYKSHEIEELDPETGKIIRTRVIYPIIKEKENSKFFGTLPFGRESKDGNASTITTPRGLPTP